MSEVDDKRELSGLARSIDALFTGGSRGAAAPAEEADAGPSAPLPTSPDVEPLPEPTELDPEPLSSPLEGPREPLLAGDELLWDLETVEPTPEAPAPPAPPPDPDELERAVDRFLAGAPGAGDEVRSVAEELQDRLALDPLANAVERLIREAGDPPDPTLVDMASAIIHPAVASRIVQRIGHERDDVAKAQYTVLCQRLGEVMAKSFRGALTGATEREARRAYYDILIAMGDTSRPIIEEMVEDENTLLVRSGVAILGEMGGDDALPLVTSALAHPDARVRREGLLALAKLGNDESGALVVGLLGDSEHDVRVAAATAAGALKVERALRPLLELLEAEGDGDGAVPLIDALGELGDPGAVPAIEKHAVKSLFSKPRTEVRVAAYRALHEIGTPHARDLVQKALSDKEPAVRAAVRHITGSSPAP
jgi:hypothetical protein